MKNNIVYNNTIRNLFELLRQANLADSLQKHEWQKADDACGDYYQAIRAAIVAIAGDHIIEHEAETGEVDPRLADRYGKPPVDVTCSECGASDNINAINDDRVRYFLPDGRIIRLGENTTQDKVDKLTLLCECCQEELETV